MLSSILALSFYLCGAITWNGIILSAREGGEEVALSFHLAVVVFWPFVAITTLFGDTE